MADIFLYDERCRWAGLEIHNVNKQSPSARSFISSSVTTKIFAKFRIGLVVLLVDGFILLKFVWWVFLIIINVFLDGHKEEYT